MRSFFTSVCAFVCLSVLIFSFSSCSKKNDEEPLVINPTVNPINYSVLVYLITPSDKPFNPDYYRAAKATILDLQSWYKGQMGDKTFVVNPVVVDTLTSLHNSIWFDSNNGPAISGTGTGYAYHNTKYELQQLLGANFDTVHYTYFAYVAASFGEETVPRGLAVEGLEDLEGISGKFPGFARGAGGHALGHAFGLPEPVTESSDGIMSKGYTKYPNCVLKPFEKDSLNASPFFQTH